MNIDLVNQSFSEGVLTITILTIVLVSTLSPIKLAFMVTLVSVSASVSMYMNSGTSFPSAALIISFSSGMMILFCYCATLSNHESKSNLSVLGVVLLSALPLILSNSENSVEMSKMSDNLSMGQTQFLIVAIMVVMVAMVCINKSMFHPQKSLMSSYWW